MDDDAFAEPAREPLARPADLTRFPELAAYGRTATRLRPLPGEVSAADSHIGGPLLWPAGEPWPACATPHMVATEVVVPDELAARVRATSGGGADLYAALGALDEAGQLMSWGTTGGGPLTARFVSAAAHATAQPLIPVAQLRASDVPDLPRPDGADLLQVLWCPFDHEDTAWGPAPLLVWRREADVTGPLAVAPPVEPGEEYYVPAACRVRPQQVVEYPYPDELPPALRDRIQAWSREDEHGYTDEYMVPGWKVGGYATWNVTDLLPTPCPACGGPTRLLLTADSCEYDGSDETGRWFPADGFEQPQEPTGVLLGRYGAMRLFACDRCPGTPFHIDVQ
ncbi:hypothetical protein [Dactylosporangium sp. CA-139066]|uniref:hypothetical protein n=1 Tax=Dactylosporangium sp. CA-139066 TaxID=3239930 RepID=UPI003D8E6C7F